jgi:hypothetical protein
MLGTPVRAVLHSNPEFRPESNVPFNPTTWFELLISTPVYATVGGKSEVVKLIGPNDDPGPVPRTW